MSAHEYLHFPPNLLTHTRGVMGPCGGLTYIIVNTKTRLVLDDPVSEGGIVSVSRLNENDTQKA